MPTLTKLYYPLTNPAPRKNNELQRPLHSGNILHYYYNNIGNNNNNNELLAKQSNININNIFAQQQQQQQQKAALCKAGFGSRVRPLWVKALPRRSDSQRRPLLLGDMPHAVYSISQSVERWTPRKLRLCKS